MIEIDGSYKEGGGQILRTALGLSMLTKKPFRMHSIRQNRPVPGLKSQHITCIDAFMKISDAKASTIEQGATEVTFHPGDIIRSRVMIDIKTAGSITLVLQSLLIPLLFHDKRISVTIIGGTDVRWSPPIDYLSHVIVPRFNHIADITQKLVKRGYFPKGSGEVKTFLRPKSFRQPFDLTERGDLLAIRGISHASFDLHKAKVAERTAVQAKSILSDHECPIDITTEYCHSPSRGSGITLWAVFEHSILGGDALGERDKPAERVAEEAVTILKNEIRSEAAIDSCCADNLIPYLSMLGGRVKTSTITDHILSNIYVCERFLEQKIDIDGTIITS